jgi:hypothetical protein
MPLRFNISCHLFPLLFILFLVSCATTSTPERRQREAIIPETTKVADPATRNALESFDLTTGFLRFKNTTPVLESLSTGDVLASEPFGVAPYGYLRKISAIRKEGDVVILETTQASLTDAVHQGWLEGEGSLEAGDLMGTEVYLPGVEARALLPDPNQLRAAVGVISEGYNFEAKIDAQLSFEGSSGPASGKGEVRVTGLFRFNAGYNVSLGIEGCLEIPPVCIDRFEASMGVEQYAGLTVTAQLQGEIKKEVKLATYYFSPIVFFIGPVPVVFVPIIDAVIGASGEAQLNFRFEASESIQYKVGVRWRDPEDAPPRWEDISEQNGFRHELKEPDLEATMRVRAYTKGDAKLLLYGVAGPSFYARLGAGLDVQIPRKPIWNIFGHLAMGVSLQIDLLGILKLAEYSKDLLLAEPILFEASNTAPRIRNLLPGPVNVNVDENVNLGPRSGGFGGGYYDVSDLEGEAVTTSVRSSLEGDLPLTYAFASPGERTITVTARDASGASSSASFIINVINTPPTLTLEADATQVAQGNAFIIRAKATDGNKPLPCSQITWSVSSPDTIVSGQNTCAVTVIFNLQAGRIVSAIATDAQGSSTSAIFAVQVVSPPNNPYPRITSAGVYSNELSGVFCSQVAVSENSSIDLRRDGCALAGLPKPKRYVAFVNVENPDNESLSYDWKLFATGGQGTYQVYKNLDPSSSTFSLYSPGNTGLITTPCHIQVTVQAPDALRNKVQTVWRGECTYESSTVR